MRQHMLHTIVVSLLLAMLAIQPHAAQPARTVSVTLSAEQLAAVTAVVAFENANIAAFNAREAAKVKAGEQAAAPRPPVTIEGIVQARLNERLRGDILWASQQEDRELSEQFRALTAAEKAAVRALLKKGKK